MKRSQALREIYILLHCGPDYPTEHEILDKLEELGMEPPAILYKPKENETSHAYYYPNGFPCNKWEPEDET